MPNLENIEWILINNSRKNRLIQLLLNKQTESKLNYINNLIKELREGNCTNLQESFSSIKNWGTIGSKISELEVANFFLQRRFDVIFLPEDYGGAHQSPDMQIINELLKINIEVTRVIDDVTLNSLYNSVDELLEKFNLQYELILGLKKDLIFHIPKGDYIQHKNKLIKQSLDEFQKKILKLK